jgi:hypothetical protein
MVDWQSFFDAEYPSGVSVTAVEDVPEYVGQDDAQFLTPRLVVVSEDELHPTVRLQIFEFEKDVTFKIEKLEDFAPGVKLVHTASGLSYLLSSNIDPKVARRLVKARKDWYGA